MSSTGFETLTSLVVRDVFVSGTDGVSRKVGTARLRADCTGEVVLEALGAVRLELRPTPPAIARRPPAADPDDDDADESPADPFDPYAATRGDPR